MTKPKGTEEYRQGYECPECKYMVGRRADLKKHLMRKHGYTAEEALEKQREGKLAYEKLTSVRVYPPAADRYSKQAPGGE